MFTIGPPGGLGRRGLLLAMGVSTEVFTPGIGCPLCIRGFDAEVMFGVIHGIINRLDLLFRDFGYVRDDGEGQEPELSEDIPSTPMRIHRLG